MQSSPVPWNVLSSCLGVGILTPGWNLDTVDSGSAEPRSFSVPVVFASEFSSIPVVHLGLTGLDVDQRDSARITLKAENISPSGFEAVISSWADSRVFAVEFNWLAIGA
jgi:hypothetical protein